MKLTKSGIDLLTCPPGKRDAMFSDDEVKGFAVRVTATGSKVFVFNYSKNGRSKRVKLGAYGDLTVASARKLAETYRGRVIAGGDPAEDKRAQALAAEAILAAQAEQAAADALTLGVLIGRWQENSLKDASDSYRKEAPQRLRTGLSALLGRPAHALTVAEVQARLDEVAQDHPTNARRIKAYGRAMYGWAEKRNLVEGNPFARVIVEGREVSRDRVLSDRELGEYWRAASLMPYPFGPFFQLLALTLQRRTEVAGMRWAEIAPDWSEWTIPAERTKNGKAHVVHLSAEARHVLAGIHRQIDAKTGHTSEFVLSGTGKTPVSGFSMATKRLKAQIMQERAETEAEGQKIAGKKPSALPAPGWHLHDLRRTGVTVMARLKIGPHVADRVLNHVEGTISGVTAVYQRHEFLTERAAALDIWAAHVLRVAENSGIEGLGDNVVPLWR